MITEILGKTTVYDNKIYINKKVRRYFDIKNGDAMLWAINKNGDLILTNSSIDDNYF